MPKHLCKLCNLSGESSCVALYCGKCCATKRPGNPAPCTVLSHMRRRQEFLTLAERAIAEQAEKLLADTAATAGASLPTVPSATNAAAAALADEQNASATRDAEALARTAREAETLRAATARSDAQRACTQTWVSLVEPDHQTKNRQSNQIEPGFHL